MRKEQETPSVRKLACHFKFGGSEGLFRMCGTCPANLRSEELAQCTGTVYQWPESFETEEQLQGIVSRLGLQAEMDKAFPKTTPLWYGLWAVSPVPPASLSLLKTLMAEMLAEDERGVPLKQEKGGPRLSVLREQLRAFERLVTALQLAEIRNLSLHVALSPPGHADLGWHTVFPHCPFCKAGAPVEPWQRKYPTALLTCTVCGTAYSPAETASSERMSEHRGGGLREVMGRDAFGQFARDYLVKEWRKSPEVAQGMVEAMEKAIGRELEHHVAQERQRADMLARRIEYLETHVFFGLPSLAPPPGEHADDEVGPAGRRLRPWFAADVFEKVLRRCAAAGIPIECMCHNSVDAAKDRVAWGKISESLPDPIGVLEQWRKEGCAEEFSAVYQVPNELYAPGKQEPPG